MGFLTNISISNDFWHNIAKDPKALVDAIGEMMNYGMESPIGEALDAKDDNENRRRYLWKRNQRVPQGVLVHRARHYDEPQIIVNTWGTHAIAAHEIAYAIKHGWLELNSYNRTHAESIVKLLEKEAKLIKEALDES